MNLALIRTVGDSHVLVDTTDENAPLITFKFHNEFAKMTKEEKATMFRLLADAIQFGVE